LPPVIRWESTWNLKGSRIRLIPPILPPPPTRRERGLQVSLDEVARHAGVGVGTVYRRFGTREELVEALFIDRIESIAAPAEAAAEAPDPWSGLVSFTRGSGTRRSSPG
jgi:tetracycline repressor-like protein